MTDDRVWERAWAEAGIMPLAHYVEKYQMTTLSDGPYETPKQDLFEAMLKRMEEPNARVHVETPNALGSWDSMLTRAADVAAIIRKKADTIDRLTTELTGARDDHVRVHRLKCEALLEIDRLTGERDEARAQLSAVVKAWESLPGPREYTQREVQAWMNNSMAPAINKARAAIEALTKEQK